MKLWGGRFTVSTDKAVDDFHSSIHFDSRMYRQDIAGSIAHAEMLGRCGVIPRLRGRADLLNTQRNTQRHRKWQGAL